MTPPVVMDHLAAYLLDALNPDGEFLVGPGVGSIRVISPVNPNGTRLSYDRDAGTGLMLSNKPVLNKTMTHAGGYRRMDYTADVALSIFYPTMDQTPYENELYWLPFVFEELLKSYPGTDVLVAGVDLLDCGMSYVEVEGRQSKSVVVDVMMRVTGSVIFNPAARRWVVGEVTLQLGVHGPDALRRPGVRVTVVGVEEPFPGSAGVQQQPLGGHGTLPLSGAVGVAPLDQGGPAGQAVTAQDWLDDDSAGTTSGVTGIEPAKDGSASAMPPAPVLRTGFNGGDDASVSSTSFTDAPRDGSEAVPFGTTEAVSRTVIEGEGNDVASGVPGVLAGMEE